MCASPEILENQIKVRLGERVAVQLMKEFQKGRTFILIQVNVFALRR